MDCMTETQETKKATPPPEPKVMDSALYTVAGGYIPGRSQPEPTVMKSALVAHENMEKSPIDNSKRRTL
jgi:hypothetical protein